MAGFKKQAWITAVLNDNDVPKALTLGRSLRRAVTSKSVAVLVSPKVSVKLKDLLCQEFDSTHVLEEDRNVTHLDLGDFAKLFALTLRVFDKCVYLSPNMMAMKNCDEVFEKFSSLTFLENMDTSVFGLRPSTEIFRSLLTGLQSRNKNGGIEGYLKLWMKNQHHDIKALEPMYNRVISLQNSRQLLSDEKGTSFVNFLEDPANYLPMLSETDSSLGLLEKLAITYWSEIYHQEVQPTIDAALKGLSPSKDLLPKVPQYEREPIAIIGMSCRYPSSNNIDEFWDLIFNGQDGLATPPDFRWTRDQSTRNRPDCRKTNAGFLKVPVDEFDAKFFGISPKEAVYMDPQHRLLHELVWEGFEDAAIDVLKLRGTHTGVFMGSWTNDFKDILIHAGNKDFYRVYMGNSIGAAAARISHLLGLTGPSVATESGCSSAMVAVHLACRSLLLGETNLAVACGVNLLLHPFDKDEMPMVISPTGSCKTFDSKADGFARAEGCGVLVLKRLSDAVRDNDHICALIRGSGMSQEGISRSMGTPTVHCEALAMKQALNDAGVEPHQVTYVEAHGTGTVVGDPMEISAITSAYHSPNRKEPLIIGSVKTNVGHTESCSGITGIMKVVLALEKEAIPPHRNFESLNPAIDLSAVPAVIPLAPVSWPRSEDKVRLAGVSSFGITGTDAHAIIEETPFQIRRNLCSSLERPLDILKLSAKTEEALDELLRRYQEQLQAPSEKSFKNFAYTANVGRANFSHRATIIAKGKEDALQLLTKNQVTRQEVTEEVGKVCFLFTGQGSQYPGMGKELYETSPIFRMHFDYCERLLKEQYNISIKDVLWSSSGNSEVARTIYSQTSIFCVEYALLKLWESWGVKPDYVLGHSLGEFAAAVCVGILSVEDAVKLVAERSLLIDVLPRGKMLVIKADKTSVDGMLRKFAGSDKNRLLDYAAVNSCQQTVVAGDSHIVELFSKFCTERNIKTLMLEATHAFHSKHMNPMLDPYRKVVMSVKHEVSLSCGYISGMRGCVVKPEDMNADYWIHHTREKVDFLRASTEAVELGCQIFIEIGPQPVLSALTMMNNEANLMCVPSLKKTETEWNTILNSVSKLYLKGVEFDWQGFDQFYNREKVRIPHYPFRGKRHWPDMMALTGTTIHPLLGTIIPNASPTKLFQNGINLQSIEFIKHHSIGKNVIFPGTGYLEMCLAAGHATIESCVETWVKPTRPMKIENLIIEAPLALEDSKTCQIQIVVDFNGDSGSKNVDWNDITVKIFHRLESDMESIKWLSHASATFSPLPTAAEKQVEFDIEKFNNTILQESDDKMIAEVYEKLSSLGLKFGPTFQSLERVWKQDNALVAQVKVPSDDQNLSQYIIHPVILDAMVQVIMLDKHSEKIKRKLHVPISIGKFIWFGSPDPNKKCYIYTQSTDKPSSCALLIEEGGKIMGAMSNVEFIDTTVKAVESVLEQQTSAMPDLWEESWRNKLGPMQHRIPQSFLSDHSVYSKEVCEKLNQKFNNPSQELTDNFHNMETYVYYLMLNALYECGWKPEKGQSFTVDALVKQLGVNQEYKLFVRYFLEVFQDEGFLKYSESTDEWTVLQAPISHDDVKINLTSPIYTETLVKNVVSTKIVARVGENMFDVLKGKVAPLNVLFPDPQKNLPTVGDFYEDYGNYFNIAPSIKDILRLRIKTWNEHVKPDGKYIYRVLEVGAGSGVFSNNALAVFADEGIDYEYDYTDISQVFFSTAEKRFEKYSKNMKFKKLNIEEDFISQGFTPEYYDLVIASDVIHATKDVVHTLQNIRKVLRPGGTLDILEQTRKNRVITFIFGLMDGFWLFEDYDLRPNHCTISAEKWCTSLKRAGFNKTMVLPSFSNKHGYIIGWSNTVENAVSTGKDNGKRLADASSKPTWLVFTIPNLKLGSYLNGKLCLNDRNVISVVSEGTVLKNGPTFTVRENYKEDFEALIKSIVTKKGVIEGIVFLWALDKSRKQQSELLQPFLYLVQEIIQLKQKFSPRVFVVTEGVAPIENNDLSQFYPSTLWGFLKTMRNEHTDINCRCIGIKSGLLTENEMLEVYYELWSGDKETQVAFSGNTRYLPRFQPLKAANLDLTLPTGTDRFQLIIPKTKSIADLQFGPLDHYDLEETEIEVQVKASALNFRDVLSVLKPTEKFKDVNTIGFDFAGIVTRTGRADCKWKLGQCVFGVNCNLGPLPSHIRAFEDDILEVPNYMTLCEATTMPAVFSTAYYCLVDVAKVKPSDIVLIHTASGGVGLSAVDIVKNIGATIIATAGSKRKHNYLRSIGIKHIFHSRNTEYGDEILKITKGRGVDVVLNSLTSEGFKEATLKACAKGARFIEMSKLNVWSEEEVKKLRPDVDYSIVDVSVMDRKEWQRLLVKLTAFLENKNIKPIPYVRFDGVHIREALRYLQTAKHIGKVVCVMPELLMERGEFKTYTPMFNDRSTYFISGGLGGIGFEVAKWMVNKGAKNVILAGRNPPSNSTHEIVKKLNSDGANIVPVQLDVSNYEQCKDLFSNIKAMGLPPLRGIMHAAGTLNDSLIANHAEWSKFSSTFNTKINGTLNLHELTKDCALEHFVVFSSVAALFGSPGQSNHAAGNNFEDTFIHYRHSIGLPATTVNWGQWGQVGIATEVDLPGMKALSTLQGISALEYVLKTQRVQTCVVNMESFVLFSKLSPQVAVYLDEKIWKSSSTTGNSLIIRSDEFWQEYDSKSNHDERLNVMKDRLRAILKFILKLDQDDIIDDNTNFQEMGVDSLMFVEIKNALQNLLGERVTVTASALRDCNTVHLLADQLVKLIEGEDTDVGSPPTSEDVVTLLREDSVLPDHIHPGDSKPPCKIQEIENVLLTGSTGTLGPYILRELCRKSQVKKIYCLVRPSRKADVTPRDRLYQCLEKLQMLSQIDFTKVECIEGNVAKDCLGVDDKNLWESLLEKVDAVFHCAIRADHTQYYRKRDSDDDVRAVNIGGLKNILDFASQTKVKHVFHASSLLSVSFTDDEGKLSEDWPECEDYDGVTFFAYPISKFIGDNLVKKAVERGIPCKVFRFPIIAGDSLTGQCAIEQNHMMLRYFYIMKCGVMPSNPFPLTLIPVDICAQVSSKIFFDTRTKLSDIYNITHDKPDLDQEFPRIAQTLGYPVEIVEFSEFAARLANEPDDSTFSMFKELYKNDEELMSTYSSSKAARIWLHGEENFWISKKVTELFPNHYENLESSMDILYRDLQFAKSNGFFQKFGLEDSKTVNN